MTELGVGKIEKRYANGWVEVEFLPNAEDKWQFRVWLCNYRSTLDKEIIGNRSRELHYTSPFEHDAPISARYAADKYMAKYTNKGK